MRWLDLPAAQVWAMGTLNPACLIGLPDKGVIRAGADADLVLWKDGSQDEKAGLTALRTWIGGRCVYSAR